MIGYVIFFTVLFLWAVVIIHNARSHSGESIGPYQSALLNTYEEGEKALRYLEVSAELSAENAVKDLYEEEGSFSTECGEYSSPLWSTEEKTCFPDAPPFFEKRFNYWMGLYLERYLYDLSTDYSLIREKGNYVAVPSQKIEIPILKTGGRDLEKYYDSDALKSRGLETGSCKSLESKGYKDTSYYKKTYGSTKEEVKKQLSEVEFVDGETVSVHNKMAPALKCVKKEIESCKEGREYSFNRIGTFNWRPMRGSQKMSRHSFGIALDINPDSNPYCPPNKKKCKTESGLDTDIPECVVDSFKKYGFVWGGDWEDSKDPMHFVWLADPEKMREKFSIGGSRKSFEGGKEAWEEFQEFKGKTKSTFKVKTTNYFLPFCKEKFEKNIGWYTGAMEKKCDKGKWYRCAPADERGFYEEVKLQGSGICEGKTYTYKTITKDKYEKPKKNSPPTTAKKTVPTPHRTIAVNNQKGSKCYIPYGSKVFINLGKNNPWTGWYIAEDTGGAFGGECKIDIFVGKGNEKEKKARKYVNQNNVDVYVFPKEFDTSQLEYAPSSFSTGGGRDVFSDVESLGKYYLNPAVSFENPDRLHLFEELTSWAESVYEECDGGSESLEECLGRKRNEFNKAHETNKGKDVVIKKRCGDPKTVPQEQFIESYQDCFANNQQGCYCSLTDDNLKGGTKVVMGENGFVSVRGPKKKVVSSSSTGEEIEGYSGSPDNGFRKEFQEIVLDKKKNEESEVFVRKGEAKIPLGNDLLIYKKSSSKEVFIRGGKGGKNVDECAPFKNTFSLCFSAGDFQLDFSLGLNDSVSPEPVTNLVVDKRTLSFSGSNSEDVSHYRLFCGGETSYSIIKAKKNKGNKYQVSLNKKGCKSSSSFKVVPVDIAGNKGKERSTS